MYLALIPYDLYYFDNAKLWSKWLPTEFTFENSI